MFETNDLNGSNKVNYKYFGSLLLMKTTASQVAPPGFNFLDKLILAELDVC